MEITDVTDEAVTQEGQNSRVRSNQLLLTIWYRIEIDPTLRQENLPVYH